MPIKSNMTNISLFVTVAAVCASIATSAPITVDQISANVMGMYTSLGPISLDDTLSYTASVPFEMTYDSGSGKVGFGGSVKVTTNEISGCNGLKTISFEGSFKLTLPSTLTTSLNTLSNVITVPAISEITSGSGITVSTEIDVARELEACGESSHCSATVRLSDLLPDKKPLLELLGTDVKFYVDLSELTLFDGGIGIPLTLIIKVLAKQDMKLQTSVCGRRELDFMGDRSAYICGQKKDDGKCMAASLQPLTYANCVACNAMCTAVGSVIEKDALFDSYINLAELLETTAEAADSSDALQGVVRECGGEADFNYEDAIKCFGVGSTKSCLKSGSEASGATQLHLNIFAIAAVAFLAFIQ